MSDWEVIYRGGGATVVHKPADNAIEAEKLGRIYAEVYSTAEVHFRGQRWMRGGHSSVGKGSGVMVKAAANG